MPDGIMRRDAHPKMHGLVQAVFTVEPDLPEDLAIGLFSEAGSYSAWIRFSNPDGTINPDIQGDIRGMAAKLMGVPGEKLLAMAQSHSVRPSFRQGMAGSNHRDVNIALSSMPPGNGST